MNHSGRLTLQSLHRQQNFAVHCFVFLATANSRASLSFLTLFLFLNFFFYQPSAFTRRPSLCPRARLSSLLSGASGNKSLAVSRQIPALQRLGERRSSQ